jgi:hypothetical protein
LDPPGNMIGNKPDRQRVFIQGAHMHLYTRDLAPAFAGLLFIETLPCVTGPGLFHGEQIERGQQAINSIRYVRLSQRGPV